MAKLNLGCGNDYRKGYLNLDYSVAIDRLDGMINLDNIPFEALIFNGQRDDYFNVSHLFFDDYCVSEILLFDVLEHLDNWIESFGECHRILLMNGIIRIRVPNSSIPLFANTDPTHKHTFTYFTFDYFDKSKWLGKHYGNIYFPDINFKIIKKRYRLWNLYFELMKCRGDGHNL